MSSDTSSNESHSDSVTVKSAKSMDFDPLGTRSATNSNDGLENPSLLEEMVDMESDNNNMEKSEESASNEGNFIGKVKLIPLNDLMQPAKKQKEAKLMDSVVLSSESSSDEPLSKLQTEKLGPQKRLTKRRSSHTAHVEISSDESENSDTDDSMPIAVKQPAEKPAETKELPDKIYSAKVKLTKLPTDMNSILAKYNLVEIRDRTQSVIASTDKNHHDEVHKHNSVFVNCFHFSTNQKKIVIVSSIAALAIALFEYE